jgi:Tol biopolymer transport system component/tRNA A-37 threonylcarbamoyl transferase component Bud32
MEVDLLLHLDDEAQDFLESPAIQLRPESGSAHDLTGRLVGVYRVGTRIGEGGMGVVYLARDTQLDRTVAIKVLPDGLVSDPDRRRRFIQEAKAASALNHPNIVTIYSIVRDGGVECIVMEHVAGRTLAQAIPRDGLPLAAVLRSAIEIADALAVAHAAGIIHRDLKPNNIMLAETGRVKMLDFGLAKLIKPEQDAMDMLAGSDHFRGTAPWDSTAAGVVQGTVAYMSPEQVEGRKLDPRSDIFSFGTVLYEMITGLRPFSGSSRAAIMSAILSEDPKGPREIRASVPAALEAVALRCLRKDPDRRYRTMNDVKTALEGIEAPKRRTRGWAAGAVAILLATGLLAWREWPVARHAEPLKAAALTTYPGVLGYPSLSPDGNHVVFMWNGPKQDNRDIYVRKIGGDGTPLRLTTDPRNDFNPVWSPDGRWIAFLRESSPGHSQLRLLPPAGGPEREVTEIRYSRLTSPPYVAWCPGGECLVVTDSSGEGGPDGLFEVSLKTGEKGQLTNPQVPTYSDVHPAVSPDGRTLVFRRHRGVGAGELYWLPLVTRSEPQLLVPPGLDAHFPAWTPNGREIVFSADGGLWRTAVPGKTAPSRLPFVGEEGLMPVISRPQPGRLPRLVYVRSIEDSNIWRIDTLGPGLPALSAPALAISSTRLDYNPHFSPDGGRVAFDSNRSGNVEIWLADSDGSNEVQLTSLRSSSGFANWSPDGRLIAFHSNAGGEWRAYLIPAAGGKPSIFAPNGWPSFSRDGKWIYFSTSRTSRGEIWKIMTTGGDAVQLTRNGGLAALESSDGKYVYYRQSPNGPGPLWRIPVAGGEPVKVLDGMFDFYVLEQGIYYIDQQTEEAKLKYLSFANGNSTLVAHSLGKVRRGLTATADGRTILFARADSSADDLMLVENFR